MRTEGHATRPRPRIHAPLAARRWPPPVDWWEEARERRARELAAEHAQSRMLMACRPRPKWHARQMVAAPKPMR